MQSTHALYDPCALCAPVRFFRRTRSKTWPRRRRTCAPVARRTTAVIATANRFRPNVAEISYSLYGRKKSKKESKRNSDDKSENHVVVARHPPSPGVKRVCLMHQNIIYRLRRRHTAFSGRVAALITCFYRTGLYTHTQPVLRSSDGPEDIFLRRRIDPVESCRDVKTTMGGTWLFLDKHCNVGRLSTSYVISWVGNS